MCDGEFRLITGKKKTRRKYFNGIQSDNNIKESNGAFDDEAFLRRLKNLRNEMKTSNYFRNSLSVLKEALSFKHNKTIKEFICLGIGSFTTCLAALHQFAFSLEVSEYFQISNPQYYDPIFNLIEKNILQSLNCTVMPSNCEGKYTICGENNTALYFPHCPKQLTNNFLWHNWNLESLKKTILLCNSFEMILQNSPERILQKEALYVLNIVDYLKEFPLVNCYQYQDIFNDTSIHIFDDFEGIGIQDIWKRSEPPEYNDIELITEKIKNF